MEIEEGVPKIADSVLCERLLVVEPLVGGGVCI